MRHAGLHEMSAKNIINMDETSIVWDAGRQKVIIPRGQRSAKLIRAGGKSSCTVSFTMSADGDLLPPFVIFKVSTLPYRIFLGYRKLFFLE